MTGRTMDDTAAPPVSRVAPQAPAVAMRLAIDPM